MGRRSIAVELNAEYFGDGVFYVKSMIDKMRIPLLFDFPQAS
jgi:hypothetical protein